MVDKAQSDQKPYQNTDEPGKQPAKGATRQESFSVCVDGHDYRVFIPPGRGCYYVRFEWRGKEYLRTLKTTAKAAAAMRAKDKVRAITGGFWEKDEAEKFRNDFATIGEVLEVYLKRAGEGRTPGSNAASLRNLVRSCLPGEADAQKSTVLTGALVREWQRVRGDLSEASVASFIRQARSVFGRRFLPVYEEVGLKLPDLGQFLKAPVKQPSRRLPRALDEGAIAQIFAAAPALKAEDPAVYVAFLMFSRLGMRNVEIEAARWGWIERTARGARMAIIERPEEGFSPKGNEGRVPIAPDVLAELELFRGVEADGTPSDGFIVPGRTKTERADVVDRRHSAWVGRWIKDRSKTSYELRRFAGSLVLELTNGDIMAVRDFLRHSDVQTTQQWYAYRLRELPAISMEEFGRPRGGTI